MTLFGRFLATGDELDLAPVHPKHVSEQLHLLTGCYEVVDCLPPVMLNGGVAPQGEPPGVASFQNQSPQRRAHRDFPRHIPTWTFSRADKECPHPSKTRWYGCSKGAWFGVA